MMETVLAQHALAFLERCPVPLVIRESTGRVTAFNAAFEQLIGCTMALSLLNLDSRALARHPARTLLDDQNLICWTIEKSNNRYFLIQEFGLSDSDQTRARLFIEVSDKVRLEEDNRKLRDDLKQHVLTDSATGLLNRRGVILALEPQVARSRRYNSPISIIALRLEILVDSDKLIVEVSRLLKDQLRWADLVGRTDEHEFILALPETTATAALRLADKIKIQINEIVQKSSGAEQIVSSYGITDWRKNDTAVCLLNRAETALNQARFNESRQLIAL